MSGLHLYLFNPAAPPGRRAIYATPHSGPSGAPSEEAMLTGTHWLSSVLLVDRRLGAIVTPPESLTLLHLSLTGVITLVVGFAITALSTGYLLLSVRRTIELEALTATLKAATVRLSEKAEEITQISRHDALTGLPNRLLLRERMDHAVARCARGAPFALLYLDLDRFKAVNDSLGHGAGDRLLVAVADRIRMCTRDTDTAARLGGDEFAILLADVENDASVPMVALRLINSVSQPYEIGDQRVIIGVSIGASIARPGAAAEAITAEADLAMYEAKAVGRGTFRIFEERMRTRVDEKRQIEVDLRRALANGELAVHYQPLVNIAHNRVAGFEALARWNHPVHGMIPPDRFIPVAEECGLIGDLGSFVLRTACADAARWPRPLNVAVNISPVQLKDELLLEKIQEVLRASGLSAERLEIELTEAAVLQHSTSTLNLLGALRARGVSVAFDDFGTGYSSLASLLRFPFDKIKIDKSFLHGLNSSVRADAIVRAVIGLGSNLALTTTGEGVETLEQLEHLRRCGCSEAQGYYFSPARPNADIPDLLLELDAKLRVRTAALT
jgi:diguanylate cyclase (GGDEF)-like protein